MSLYRGAVPITGIFRGAVPITAVFRGTTLLYSPGGGDNFERDDGPLGSNWTDLGTAPDWKLGIEDGVARVLIPDAILGFPWDSRTSFMRYNVTVASQDDGFVECRPATRGDSASFTKTDGFHSQVWGKGNNTGGSATNGAGIHMQAGHLWIAKRVSGTGTKLTDCGTFQPGDVIRLRYSGATATMAKNGQDVGTAPLTGVLSNSSNRSLIIRGDGGKDTLGPRRFSPALDYVLMG